jgi:menaquinone-dependent protoporphyrinogen oxidase
MRVLVAYGSKMGGTAGLAEMIGRALEERAVSVEVRPAAEVTSVGPYDAVIVGGALYAGRWHRSARGFVRRLRGELRDVPVWFFSSGPLGDLASDHHIPPVLQVRVLMRQVGARGHKTFGGRLVPNPPGFVARMMAKTIAGDWRDPAQVDRWVGEIVAVLDPARSHVRG